MGAMVRLSTLILISLITVSLVAALQNVTAINPNSNPTLLWNYTTSNGVWSSPTVNNGLLYIGCEDIVYTGIPYGQGLQYFYAGNLYALNAATGEKLWNYSIPVGGSSPAIAEGIVYVGSFDSNVYAFNASNGEKLWNYPTEDVVSSSPAVADGIVYVGLSDGNLCALNGTTGQELWKYHSIGGVGSPIVKDGVVFAISNTFIPLFTYTGDIYALNATNGKMLWDYNLNNSVSFPISVPTVKGETVYVGLGSNVSALRSADGSQLWTSSIDKQAQPSLTPILLRPGTISDNVLYIGSSGGGVYAFDADNGEKIWSHSIGNQSETSPAVANRVVYIGSNDGNLYGLNSTNGEVLWSYPISDADHALESSPVVADGVIYIGSGTHNVYAFTTAKPPKASSNLLIIMIAALITVIVIFIAVIILPKRLKSKPRQSREMPHKLT